MTKRKSTRTRTSTATKAVDYPIPKAADLADWQAPTKDTSGGSEAHMFYMAGRWLYENRDRLLNGARLPFHYKSVPPAFWEKKHLTLQKALEANGFDVQKHTAYINTNMHITLMVSVQEGE